jgi:hypothetical protein
MTTLTINVVTKEIVQTGVPALREHVTVRLVSIGTASPGNLVLYVYRLGREMAKCLTFALVGANVEGTLALDGTAITADFATLADPQGKRQFDVAVYDNARQKLLVNTKLDVMNNPYVAGMTPPTPL